MHAFDEELPVLAALLAVALEHLGALAVADLGILLDAGPLLAHEVPRRLEVRPDQPVTVRFARPVPWDHLVELTYRLDVPRWSQLLGSAPWMTVQFFDGDEPLGEWMVVPGLQLGREVTQPLPVHPEMAEWRWVAERAPPEARTDRARYIG